MEVDPVGSLRPVDVIVGLGEWEYTIPALPAVEWIAAAVDPYGGAIVPGLLCEVDRAQVWRDYARGTFDGDELAAVERDALGVAAGRPWWTADRLIREALRPENRAIVYGELMLAGLRLDQVSLSAALDAIYALIRRLISHDEAALARFDAGLAVIPAGVQPEELEDETTSLAEFQAMMIEQAGMMGG